MGVETMEDFILGLLMGNQLTAYELHVAIKNNYKDVCSDSIGNIQRALKKLHEKGHVSLEEVKEGKVVKKIFSITKEGRSRFLEWLRHPVAINKVKNMELGRLLMLGFLSPLEQLENIEKVVADLKEEQIYLQKIKEEIEALESGGEEVRTAFYEKSKTYLDELIQSVSYDSFASIQKSTSKFSTLVLKFAIDANRFELDWFENLRVELAGEIC